jgi:8-oxo-dGTP diphosphatase
MNTKPIICADAIARYGSKIVIVERLSSVPGLALPGGKQDPDETLSKTAIREFTEETGLSLSLLEVLGTYAEEGRDPRGNFISTVFTGIAAGIPKDETRKTCVIFLDKEEILAEKERFVFDHFQVLSDYFKRG